MRARAFYAQVGFASLYPPYGSLFVTVPPYSHYGSL